MEPTPDRENKMPTAAPEIVATPAYQFDEDGDDFVLRIPKSMAARDQVQRFLDRLEFEQLRTKSQLTPEDAEELAREVKHAVVERLRQHLDSAAGAVASAEGTEAVEAGPEDEMERLYFMSRVERGLRQFDTGQFVSHEEAKRRFGR